MRGSTAIDFLRFFVQQTVLPKALVSLIWKRANWLTRHF